MIRLLTAIGLALMTTQALAQVQVPKSYSDGEVIYAEELNNNLKAIADAVPPRDCTTDQIIKWDGSDWVCATDPFAGLNCAVGDQLRMGSSGWECRAGPETARLEADPWFNASTDTVITEVFDTLDNVNTNSFCNSISCYISVVGVTDHASCIAQVTGGAVSMRDIQITTSTNAITIGASNTWNPGSSLYIDISCIPA